MLSIAEAAAHFVSSSGESHSSADAVDSFSRALARRIGEQRYDLWFDRKTRVSLDGNAVIVEAGNAFAANWIRSKFGEEMREAAAEALRRTVEICVRVGAEVGAGGAEMPRAVQADAAPRRGHATVAAAPGAGAVINPRYTLEEFVVGPANQLAYHAALQVAAHPGEQFNPLFLHGHCGLGKTHLLQGICQRFARLHPGKRWLYLTGEQFTNEFLEALKLHKMEGFRKRIRNADLLVIDDVHFLANKKATQEEFLHTFNQIDAAAGKQIVLASDCAPRHIQSLSEQLSSRFVSGMVLRIDAPDLPTRLEILRRRAARNGWEIGDAVLMHVAQSATSSVRELEGLLLQVVAGMRLINDGSPAAQRVVASIKDRTAMRGPVPVERIVEAVAQHLCVEASAILGAGREKAVAAGRALAIYLARQHTGMSFPEIGRAMGNKNHSTAIAACQRVEAWLAAGEVLRWNTAEGPRHQAVADVLHDLEAAVRRGRA
ncbi:MAG TPA: chromosomal replication initiator protein DnaA [Phycisphaerae bacterium]|nr:chromosomal replication initiator protein DnaA [Phycisphaerae bacterium]